MLILLDIDGTLITVTPAARGVKHKQEIFRRVMKKVYGVEGARYVTVLAEELYGLTDIQIAEKTLLKLGVDGKMIAERMPEAVEELRAAFAELDRNGVRSDFYLKLPGVDRALAAFRELGFGVALCTGNIKCVARTKLRFAGLDLEDFLPGGFGDDAEDRAAIIETAMKRNPEFPRGKVIYFGDTLRDIEAARRAGVPCFAVAYTGEFSTEELSGADFVFTSWEDQLEEILNAIERFSQANGIE